MQRLFDVHGERELAKNPQQLHAEVRAVWQRQHELLEELTWLLDDAQRAHGATSATRTCDPAVVGAVVRFSRAGRVARRPSRSPPGRGTWPPKDFLPGRRLYNRSSGGGGLPDRIVDAVHVDVWTQPASPATA